MLLISLVVWSKVTMVTKYKLKSGVMSESNIVHAKFGMLLSLHRKQHKRSMLNDEFDEI